MKKVLISLTVCLLISFTVVGGALSDDCWDRCPEYASSKAQVGTQDWLKAKIECQKRCTCLKMPMHKLCRRYLKFK